MSTKPERKMEQPDPLSREALQAFDDLTGLQPGYRPVHAKGILLSGTFTASASGKELTKAPHMRRESVPVVVRFSDFAGVPTVPDYDVENASPRGCAVRFFLAEHSHTDIIGHSVNGFPVRTVEEFLQFLRALGASGPGAAKPTPKPIPTSFAKESFFGVNAYKFTNTDGVQKFGRYRIVPEDGNEYLDAAAAAKQSPDFLFEDIKARTSKGAVKMRILVQVAAEGDVVDDGTVTWPEERPLVEFGTIELNGEVPDNDAAQRQIIFDPIPRVDGIEPSGDPLLEPRAAVYLTSGRRRRAAV
jgi:catalase